MASWRRRPGFDAGADLAMAARGDGTAAAGWLGSVTILRPRAMFPPPARDAAVALLYVSARCSRSPNNSASPPRLALALHPSGKETEAFLSSSSVALVAFWPPPTASASASSLASFSGRPVSPPSSFCTMAIAYLPSPAPRFSDFSSPLPPRACPLSLLRLQDCGASEMEGLPTLSHLGHSSLVAQDVRAHAGGATPCRKPSNTPFI